MGLASGGIVIEHLVKRFGERAVVDDLTLHIQPGELFVLVGPSGCGKTTTLRLLAGLEPVSEGRIYFGERLVNDIRPRDRNVAMVFQDYAIFPHLTVFENIAYGLRARHAPRSLIRERVTSAARLFRIEHLLERKPRQLSGGERQRVALARAMVRDAALYLYDEPLANLDAQLRHQAREDILTLHRQKGQPAVYVTHDQAEAMALGDRIAVMRDGKLQQVGSGLDLYERPCNQFVAFFIGTPGINLFEVEVRPDEHPERAGRLRLVHTAFSLPVPEEFQERVAPYRGQRLTLGIRPEHLQPPRRADFAVSEDSTIRGLVNVIEPTVSGCTVYLSTLEPTPRDFVATLKARLPGSYLGREIPLAVNLRKIHLFDPADGRALLHGATASTASPSAVGGEPGEEAADGHLKVQTEQPTGQASEQRTSKASTQREEQA
uniref:Glycerol-3-phosphate ABC transporter ATP-binding protein n=1 Tax=Thermogemmatispora argillosa TaxID=2045280 RepID=A0A455T177_9CHLR|nr:glycerol-3-phosphate ABC transporter ATP-binding protein [Thermogemmatispora argillosa]